MQIGQYAWKEIICYFMWLTKVQARLTACLDRLLPHPQPPTYKHTPHTHVQARTPRRTDAQQIPQNLRGSLDAWQASLEPYLCPLSSKARVLVLGFCSGQSVAPPYFSLSLILSDSLSFINLLKLGTCSRTCVCVSVCVLKCMYEIVWVPWSWVYTWM